MANDGGKKDKEDSGIDPKAMLGDSLRKLFGVGVSAAFMTEESIRQYLGDLKLPKEILNGVLQSATRSKDEITNRVSNEIIKIVDKIDWVKELARFAETHKFKIQAEIDIVRKDDIKPEPSSNKSSSNS